jgi:hypothetical protein
LAASHTGSFPRTWHLPKADTKHLLHSRVSASLWQSCFGVQSSIWGEGHGSLCPYAGRQATNATNAEVSIFVFMLFSSLFRSCLRGRFLTTAPCHLIHFGFRHS